MLEHLLYMLSSGVEPDPDEEIRWHARQCAAPGAVTAVASIRNPRQLSPGQSKVAFYGDSSLGNRLLGSGSFVEFVPIGGRRGGSLLESSELYGQGRHPPTIQGMLLLRDVREAPPGSSIASLNGVFGATNQPLRPENLPEGAARMMLYYRRAAG